LLLSACQADAAAGSYALALAGYVRWLAPRYAAIRDGLRAEVAALRDRVHLEGQHARTPAIVADLAAGWRYFLDYALAAGAITAAERAALDRRVWSALTDAARGQAEHIQAAEPTALFLRLLAGALASGRAHVAAPNGQYPADAQRWGWRREPTREGPDWTPQGRRIGWVEDCELLLEPEASYAQAQALAHEQGESLPVTPRTLWRRMRERGLLASWDDARQRSTVRRCLEDARRDVLHLNVGTVLAATEEDDEDDDEDDDGDGGDQNGTVAWDGQTAPGAQPSQQNNAGASCAEGNRDGRDGWDGSGEKTPHPPQNGKTHTHSRHKGSL
jgi:hypothetical protein